MTEELTGQDLQPPRGTRDFPPAQAKQRLAVQAVIEEQFRSFGFSPLITPAFENYSVLSAKFAGGEEILKETYRFTDQGQRPLGLRYDFTVPLCRFVASNPSLPRPFKRYAIGSVWRDGPLKAGRYREFTQCDADTIGAPTPIADAELISLASSIFYALKLNATIKLNSRKLLGALMEKAGVADSQQQVKGLLILDKLEKAGWAQVGEEWVRKGLEKESIDALANLLTLPKGNLQVLDELEARLASTSSGPQAISELKGVLQYCDALGCRSRIIVDPSLARGLNYYTGPIFEAVLTDGATIGLTSSIAAGGRYDDLITKFGQEAGKVTAPTPAVGISFGLDILTDALVLCKIALEDKSAPSAYVAGIDAPVEAAKAAGYLRSQGIPCTCDLLSRSLAKNLEAAAKAGCRYAIIIGPAEVKAGKVKLKDLSTGVESTVDLQGAAQGISSAASL